MWPSVFLGVLFPLLRRVCVCVCVCVGWGCILFGASARAGEGVGFCVLALQSVHLRCVLLIAIIFVRAATAEAPQVPSWWWCWWCWEDSGYVCCLRFIQSLVGLAQVGVLQTATSAINYAMFLCVCVCVLLAGQLHHAFWGVSIQRKRGTRPERMRVG